MFKGKKPTAPVSQPTERVSRMVYGPIDYADQSERTELPFGRITSDQQHPTVRANLRGGKSPWSQRKFDINKLMTDEETTGMTANPLYDPAKAETLGFDPRKLTIRPSTVKDYPDAALSDLATGGLSQAWRYVDLLESDKDVPPPLPPKPVQSVAPDLPSDTPTSELPPRDITEDKPFTIHGPSYKYDLQYGEDITFNNRKEAEDWEDMVVARRVKTAEERRKAAQITPRKSEVKWKRQISEETPGSYRPLSQEVEVHPNVAAAIPKPPEQPVKTEKPKISRWQRFKKKVLPQRHTYPSHQSYLEKSEYERGNNPGFGKVTGDQRATGFVNPSFRERAGRFWEPGQIQRSQSNEALDKKLADAEQFRTQLNQSNLTGLRKARSESNLNRLGAIPENQPNQLSADDMEELNPTYRSVPDLADPTNDIFDEFKGRE